MAREGGLTESEVDQIADGYAAGGLTARDVAALRLTDAIIGDPRTVGEELRAVLQGEFSDEEVVELALGVALFLSMSKVLITLGLEPEQMPVTVLPTPGTGRTTLHASGPAGKDRLASLSGSWTLC